MADIVNLRTARKQKARRDKDQAAEANRVLYGRSKAERQRAQAEADRATVLLDGHRRETTDK